MSQVSRRNLLKGALAAGATIPFARLHHVLDQWNTRIYQTADPTTIRLNLNENPYGPSEQTKSALIEAIRKCNRYSRDTYVALQNAIADLEGLKPEQILITAGSTEILGVAGLLAGLQTGKVISCHPTFPFLMEYAKELFPEWVKVPLTPEMQYNLPGINDQMDDKAILVFVCNPNNPTGTELPVSMLEPFCNVISERCMVFVDEAYIEYSTGGLDSSLARLTANNENIVISRTFSKLYGMAGLRVGYAIAHPSTIARMKKFMTGGGGTPSVVSVEAARTALTDDAHKRFMLDLNAAAKENTYAKFKEWGVEHVKSYTNFVWFKTDRFGDQDLVKSLSARNVLIRAYADVPGWARVSMGTPDDMEVFYRVTGSLLR